MFLVENLYGDFDQPLVIARHGGAGIADTGFYVRDGVGNAGEHPGPIFRGHKYADRLDLILLAFGPVYLDDTVLIDHQLGYILAPFVVNNDPFPERNVADNVLAAEWVAASCAGG